MLISICIPTYNGEDSIESTLYSLVNEIENLPVSYIGNIEIIISDDCSSDLTYEKALGYSKKIDWIKVFRNELNLGMDKNFEKVVRYSSAKYIWYFGQDDLILHGRLGDILIGLNKYEPNLVSLNYAKVDSEGNTINPSVLKGKFRGKIFEEGGMQFFENYLDFFSNYSSVPSFLPATIFNASYWKNFDSKPYLGTAYVQVGCILESIATGRILVCREVSVRGLVPNDKWQSNGTSLVKIALGNLMAKTIAMRRKQNSMPISLMRKDKLAFILNFYFFIGQAKQKGFSYRPEILDDFNYIFQSTTLLNLYFKPILKYDLLTQGTHFRILSWIKKRLLRLTRF